MNSFEQYYINQAGNGITGFSGYRYQKGDGFFGRLITGTLLPLLKKSLGFLGKNALQAGVNIGSDLLDKDNINMETIKEVAKKRGIEQSKAMASKVLKQFTSNQGGTGRRRRRYRRKKVNNLIKGVPKRRRTRKYRKRRSRKSYKKNRKIKAKDFLSA